MPLIPPNKKIDVATLLPSDYADHPQLRECATEIGVLAYAWSSLHLALMNFFVSMLFGPDGQDENHLHHYDIAKAIWHSIKSDSGQRDVLRSLAKVVLAGEPYVLTDLLWALDEIDRLAKSRNDAIHTAITIYGNPDPSLDDFVGVDYFAGPPRAERLKDKDLGELYAAASLHALNLEKFFNCLWHLVYGWQKRPRSWPERPSLRSVLHDPSPPKNNQARNRTKRKRQPRSSQA